MPSEMNRSRTSFAAMAALCLFLATMVFSACGAANDETQDLAEGEAVHLGDLRYNVIFSRYLNAADPEDEAYLVGQPPVDADGLYFGVFVQVENTGDESAALPTEFRIEDTTGEEFTSIESDSLYALPLGEDLEGGAKLPEPDSTAQTGPIEGSMVLFQIPLSTTDNRPLKLVIPGEEEDATIDLDL